MLGYFLLLRKSQIRHHLGVLLLFILVFLAQGCQYDPNAHLLTNEKPLAKDVAGRYILKSQTVALGGLSALQGRSSILDLRVDGTFIASNVPRWEFGSSPGTNFFSTLISGSGTWRIGTVGAVSDGLNKSKLSWGVYLDSKSAKFMPVGFTEQKPPYGLIFTLGDPDSGEAMIYERVTREGEAVSFVNKRLE